MSDNKELDFTQLLFSSDHPRCPAARRTQKMASSLFPPELDCDLWLRCNSLNSFEKLGDLHYALYHRCSKGVFQVSKTSERQFKIAGDHTTLTVPNEGSRQYLVYQLRKLTVREMRRAWRAGNRERKVGAANFKGPGFASRVAPELLPTRVAIRQLDRFALSSS